MCFALAGSALFIFGGLGAIGPWQRGDMWIDSDLLIITDSNGGEVGFSLNGRNAAKSFLQNFD